MTVNKQAMSLAMIWASNRAADGSLTFTEAGLHEFAKAYSDLTLVPKEKGVTIPQKVAHGITASTLRDSLAQLRKERKYLRKVKNRTDAQQRDYEYAAQLIESIGTLIEYYE